MALHQQEDSVKSKNAYSSAYKIKTCIVNHQAFNWNFLSHQFGTTPLENLWVTKVYLNAEELCPAELQALVCTDWESEDVLTVAAKWYWRTVWLVRNSTWNGFYLGKKILIIQYWNN